jgi:hypothetical protein
MIRRGGIAVGSQEDPSLKPLTDEVDWEAGGWAEEPEPMTAASQLGAIISVRLDPETAELVRRAARSQGMTQAAFVREATRQAATSVVTNSATKPKGLG